MLPKKYRLAKKKDFESVFKKGKSARGTFLIIKILKHSSADSSVSRFGFVVSKKVSAKAVERNKVRRRLAQIAGKELNRIVLPADVVIVALPASRDAGFKDLGNELINLFQKLYLLK